MKIAQVLISVLSINQLVTREKRFFQCIKGYTIGKYPAFLGLLSVWIDNPDKYNACDINQKIVTA